MAYTIAVGTIIQIVLWFVLVPCSFVGCCLWNKRARRLAALPISTSPQQTKHLICSRSNKRPPKKGAPCTRFLAKKCCTIFCGMGGIQPVTSLPFLLLGMVKEISENVFAWINYVDAAPYLPNFQAKGALYVTVASGILDVLGFVVMLYAIPKYKLKTIKDEENEALHAVNSSTKISNDQKKKRMGRIQENVMTLEYFSDSLRIFVSGVYFFTKIKSGLKINNLWTMTTVLIQLFLSAVGANSALRKRYGLRFRRTIYQVQPNEGDPMCGRWWCFFCCNIFSQSITVVCLLSALIFIPSFYLNFSCCSEMPCWVTQKAFNAGMCDLNNATAFTQCANDPSMLLSMNASSRANYVSCGTRFVASPQCAACESAWEDNQEMFNQLLEKQQPATTEGEKTRTLKDEPFRSLAISRTRSSGSTSVGGSSNGGSSSNSVGTSRRSTSSSGSDASSDASFNDKVNADPGCGVLDDYEDTGIVYEVSYTIENDKKIAFCCPKSKQMFNDNSQCIPYPYQTEFESRPYCICGPGREVQLSEECGAAADCAGNCTKCDANCNEVLQKLTCTQNNAYQPFALRTCETAWQGYSSLLACNANVLQRDTLVSLAETLVFVAIIVSSYFWAIFPAMSCIYGCCFGCCFCMPHGIEARFNEIKKRGVPERLIVLGPGWFSDSTKGLILHVPAAMEETEGQVELSTSVMNPVNVVEKSSVIDGNAEDVESAGSTGSAEWIDEASKKKKMSWKKAVDPS